MEDLKTLKFFLRLSKGKFSMYDPKGIIRFDIYNDTFYINYGKYFVIDFNCVFLMYNRYVFDLLNHDVLSKTLIKRIFENA